MLSTQYLMFLRCCVIGWAMCVIAPIECAHDLIDNEIERRRAAR